MVTIVEEETEILSSWNVRCLKILEFYLEM